VKILGAKRNDFGKRWRWAERPKGRLDLSYDDRKERQLSALHTNHGSGTIADIG
jgi:hypothetical protein